MAKKLGKFIHIIHSVNIRKPVSEFPRSSVPKGCCSGRTLLTNLPKISCQEMELQTMGPGNAALRKIDD